MTTDELTFPEDWPNKDWERIDSLLRCSICQEFFTAAMLIPQCSHNFCSLCIREAFEAESGADKRCPVCRTKTDAQSLKNNRLLDELVAGFKNVRQLTIDALSGVPAKTEEMPEMPKVDHSEEELEGRERKRPRRSYPKQECIVCHKKFDDVSKLEEHVNDCLDGKAKSDVETIVLDSDSSTEKEVRNPQEYQITNTRRKMKATWLNGMKLKDLKNKLIEHGICTEGTRNELENRFKQYMIIWNAACDNKDYVPDQEIMRQYKEWEKTQMTRPKARIDSAEAVLSHAMKYRDDFDAIVQQMKRKADH